MRICIVYDCLVPYTYGGAQVWYRELAEDLVGEGHEVTYLTLRQWEHDVNPSEPFRLVPVGWKMGLYGKRQGERRILPPLVFGLGVFWHMLRHGRQYDVVHMCSFPYCVPAVGMLRRRNGYRVMVDWFEVLDRRYWTGHYGPLGLIGALAQWICMRFRQQAFCSSPVHEARLRAQRVNGPIARLPGLYVGTSDPPAPRPADQMVLFVGRMIADKRVQLAVEAYALASTEIEGLTAEFVGVGPQRRALAKAIKKHKLQDVVSVQDKVEDRDCEMRRALCLLHPSSREGYGMVVVEAAALGTPVVLVRGRNNAATELIEEGVNGMIVDEPSPAAVAEAIVRIHAAGFGLRESTANWFAENAERVSVERSLAVVRACYGAINAEA